jgi:hypothetical protein
VIGAERNGEKIAVEIKSFTGRSVILNLRDTLGQFDIYQSFLKRLEPDRSLYVAISQVAYDTLFQDEAIQMLVEDRQIPLLVVKIDTQEVLRWIPK